MYRAVIADDEKKIRMAIKGLGAWESLGISLIGECKDGDELFEKTKEWKPDIVITDMKMPGLCGNNLIRELCCLNPSVKILIISGYDEFEYVRQALVSRAVDYLLKPVMEEDLNAALKKAVWELNLEKEQEQTKQQKAISEQIDYFLDGEECGLGVLRESLCQKENNQLFGAASIAFYKENKEYTMIEKEALLILLKEITVGFGVCAQDSRESGNHLILFTVPENHGRNQLAEKIITAAQEKGFHAAIGFGCLYHLPDDLRSSYSESRLALLQIKPNSLSTIVFYDEVDFTSQIDGFELEHLKYLMELVSANGATAQMKKYIKLFFESFCGNKDFTVTYLRREVNAVLQILRKHLNNCNVEERYYRQLAILEDEIAGQWDAVVILEKIEGLLDQLPSRGSISTDKRGAAYLIKSYLDHHYCEKISLNDLAEQFFLNKEYLSKMFRQEFSLGIFEYLDYLKIEEAKKLLAEGYTSAVVTEKVGYYDESHFSRKFKKMTGMTPKELKNAK